MDNFQNTIKEIFDEKYNVQIIEDDPFGFTRLIEFNNIEFELLPGENFIKKLLDQFDEDDADVSEYYFNFSIGITEKDDPDYDKEPEIIKLREGTLNDEIIETHDLNGLTLETVENEDFQPGKYKFKYIGIDCFYGKYRGYIDIDELRDAAELSFDSANKVKNKKDFAFLIDDLLTENYEWTREDDPDLNDIYYVLEK